MPTSGPLRIGPYQLVTLLRKGQVCEIWEVERLGMLERFAMKRIPLGPRHTREQINYLRHEYQVGSRLEHPAIIETREFGKSKTAGTYLLLELFREPNLKQRIHQGVGQMAHQVETIIRGCAAGLAYMHQQGWVHRDVKPDNFLISDAGVAKLIDFNLAQRCKGRLGQLLNRKLGGKIQGTQSYMSPEQIRGGGFDPRSDIYSFGCLIHELLAGKPPFVANSTHELLHKHLKTRPPSLETVCDNVSAQFPKLILRMLAKKPRDRFSSIEEFLAELDETKIFRNKPKPPPTLAKAP